MTTAPPCSRDLGLDKLCIYEVKFRHRIGGPDLLGMRRFMEKYRCPWGIVVTRDTFELAEGPVLLVPLRDFLLAY